MEETIKKQNIKEEFYTSEKCYITELSNTPDDPDVSITRAKVEPGVTTRWHRLKGTFERYVIISGRGIVEVGKLPPQEVTAGNIVLIPPMCRQRITNIGLDDLIFLAICSPRFSQDVYEDIDDVIKKEKDQILK
jgi:mannose-6-phosphate isomerase-like protein (cupin superfamily)